jgi:acetylornithine deacetylase/succinyl-diaminopimelate desuccinylase-like protein
MMKHIGVSARLMETNGHPVVFGELKAAQSDTTVLIYGHYDVQPAEPYEAWETPPFEPTIRDGKIYARGVGDNKGQLMAQVLAMKTLLSAYGQSPVHVKFLFEGEEESSSRSFESFVQANKDLLKADVVYTSDGPLHSSGAPIVILGCRGMLYLELRAKSAHHDNHSGNHGGIVPNPAWKLVHLLSTMVSPAGDVLVDGFYDNVKEPTDYELALLRGLPYSPEEAARTSGLETLSMSGETYYRRISMLPTFNISGLSSGYSGDGIKTVIPSTATVKLDLRLVVNQDPHDILDRVQEHVRRYAPDVQVKCIGSIKPSRTPAHLPIVKSIIGAIETSFDRKPLVLPSTGATFPDYVFTEILNTPSVLVPYANADENNHAPNENMDISCFFQGIRCTCEVLLNLRKGEAAW